MSVRRPAILLGLTAAAALSTAAGPGPAYTNQAGEAILGRVAAYDGQRVTLVNGSASVRYPISVFLPSERRRMACDAGKPLVPGSLAPSLRAYRQATARSRARCRAGLITREESDRFCARARESILFALRKALADHALTEQEFAALESGL